MSMQYQGWVSLNGTKIPVRSSTVAVQPNPIIIEDAIIGGVPGSRFSPINYAEGKIKINGEIRFPFSNAFAPVIFDAAITNRDSWHDLIVDDSITKYTHKAKVASLTISGQAESVLECTMGFECISRVRAGHDPGMTGFTATDDTDLNENPVPFWNSIFEAHTVPTNNITAWSLSINNNPFVHSAATGSRLPDDVQLGLQTVQGSFTYYPLPAGTPPSGPPTDTYGDSSAGDAFPSGHGIEITLGAGGSVIVPTYLVTRDNRDLTNPNQKALRVVAFAGFGDGTTPAARWVEAV